MPMIQVPLSWLRELVPVDIPAQQIADLLHMSGTAVERVERTGGSWDKVWVAKVTALERHPKADHLWLATVDYGDGRKKTVVTGAANFGVGAIVPYAEVGARLRKGEAYATLEPKRVRGILSEGMVCSAYELDLGEDHEGILVLDPALPVGAPLADVLGDTVLHLEIQPNRPDCMGMFGVARELAALARAELREPPLDPIAFGALRPELLSVRIEDPAGCTRFAAAYLEGIRQGPSPAWMRERLHRAGMRPIDSVVDITNYVMLEIGQPLHAYDATALRGRALVARRARQGEHLRTLDGVDRMLPSTALVIADEERALGVAGILGGEGSEIRPGTTVVALECASFEPRGIRRTATQLDLHGSSGSAAARRFGLDLSQDLVPLALARAVRLLREHAGARLVGAVDVYPRPRIRANVRLRFSDFGRVLGVDVPRDEAVDVLRRLGFTYADDGDVLVVTPPAIRTDVGIAEDVVEEVARIIGYDRIPTRMPDGPLPVHEAHPLEQLRERVRDLLVGLGLQEIVSYSLIDPAWLGRLTAGGAVAKTQVAPEPLRVANPLTVAQSVARPTLRPSLLDTAARNLRHRAGVAIFEISPVYIPRANDLPEERWTIGILLSGEAEPQSRLAAPRDWDLDDLRGIVHAVHLATRSGRGTSEWGAPGLHPGRSWQLIDEGRSAVVAGQLDPRVAAMWDLPVSTFIAELDLAALLDSARPIQAGAPPRYPAALRDLGIVVDERVPYGDVAREVHAAGKGTLEQLALLDVYRGPQVGDGKKSFALRLVFRSPSGTLSEADVEKATKRIEGRLAHALQATIRN